MPPNPDDRVLREILKVLDKASEAGTPDAQLSDMIDRLIDSWAHQPDNEYRELFDSAFETLVTLRVALEAVGYLAAERVNNDRPMADTRLNAIIELTKVILSHHTKRSRPSGGAQGSVPK
jgi:signal transduction histidine kinase